MDILKEIAEDLKSKRIKTKIIKNENGEYIETELYHGSRQTKEKINSFDDNMSRDNAVSVWFTPDKEYASEYGTVHKYKVEIRNPLDLREETTPDIEFGQKDMTVQEWVDLFNSKGVSVDIKDDEWVDVYVKLWDLLYGYDIDATKATNINQSLMNSNYDFIIHKEVGSYKNIVDAFGKIKKSFRLEGSSPSGN
jgi:hypothetical protein